MLNGSIFREVRLSRGMTQKDFAAALNIPQPFLSAIERGKKPAPELVTARLRHNFPVPDGVLRAEPSPYLAGDLNFRTYKVPAAIQEAARVTFTWVERAARGALGSMPFADLAQEGFEDRAAPLLPEIIEESAAKTRKFLELAPTGPVKNVTRALERKGIPVVFLKNPYVDLDRIDGVSSPKHGERPVIAVTEQEAGDRVRFTRSHELGHIVLHQRFRPGIEAVREDEANLFAGAFLLPAEDAHREFSPSLTPAGYAQVKARYGISIAAGIRRALELNIIDKNRYRSLMIQISSRGWRTIEPVRVPAETINLLPDLDALAATASQRPEPELHNDANIIDLFNYR